MSPLKIFITGTTGESMPPPYAGVQNISLLYAKAYKKLSHTVGVSFVYRPENSDDLGAGAEYFFEYDGKPNKFKKIIFLIKYILINPVLYFTLLYRYFKINPRISIESFLYSSYGVWVDGIIFSFKPDIITSQTALIKTFMVGEIAKMRNIPVVYDTYAEVHDLNMGVNKHLGEKGREKYWKYLLDLSQLVIGMDNCSIGPLMYLPSEKVKNFYDACDFQFYQKELKENKEDVRLSYGLPKDKFIMGITGAYHYRKGHDHLIKAISILNKKGYKDICAVLVGGNIGIEKWVELTKKELVENNIYFLQNLDEENKWRLYKSIDGYCNLSNSARSCGLDLALLEAMSCSLPIVVYDNGVLPSSVPKGENGIIIPTDDINALSMAILDIYEKNIDERKIMGKKSNEVAKKTDVNITAEIKIEWFKKVINDFNKSSPVIHPRGRAGEVFFE